MRLSHLAPVGAVSAVAGGVALLGASLGGIASVDRELASANARPTTTVTPARFVPSTPRELRIVRLADDRGGVVLVLEGRGT